MEGGERECRGKVSKRESVICMPLIGGLRGPSASNGEFWCEDRMKWGGEKVEKSCELE